MVTLYTERICDWRVKHVNKPFDWCITKCAFAVTNIFSVLNSISTEPEYQYIDKNPAIAEDSHNSSYIESPNHFQVPFDKGI